MTTSPAPRLILVEGMPGAGKTTTAKQLAEWLPQQGIPARCYPEMADDNPIRTPGVDAMRANHPQVRPLPDTGADGFAKDPSVYAIEQWGRLAARARDGAEVLILESRYIRTPRSQAIWRAARATTRSRSSARSPRSSPMRLRCSSTCVRSTHAPTCNAPWTPEPASGASG